MRNGKPKAGRNGRTSDAARFGGYPAIRLDSINKYGERIAEEYLRKIELSLVTISDHPGVLCERGISDHLRLYFSGKHVLFAR